MMMYVRILGHLLHPVSLPSEIPDFYRKSDEFLDFFYLASEVGEFSQSIKEGRTVYLKNSKSPNLETRGFHWT